MLSATFKDGNVWMVFGFLAMSLFLMLGHVSSTAPTMEFLRGICIGLAIAAFAVSLVMAIARHAGEPRVEKRPNQRIAA